MSTVNVWTYRKTLSPPLADPRRVVGYDVVATDGSIGKVDEASTETGRNYLVVDTGFWIFGKKRLVPAGVVTQVDHEDRKVHMSLSKDEIKQAPDFEDRKAARDDAYYEKHASYYDRYGW